MLSATQMSAHARVSASGGHRSSNVAEAERTGRLRESNPKASPKRLAGCADRNGGAFVQAAHATDRNSVPRGRARRAVCP